MKQTAVEWLVEKFNQCEPMYSGIQSLEHKHYLDNLIEQAKAMESKERLKHQLFIGKVTEILGFDKTVELLKQCNNEL